MHPEYQLSYLLQAKGFKCILPVGQIVVHMPFIDREFVMTQGLSGPLYCRLLQQPCGRKEKYPGISRHHSLETRLSRDAQKVCAVTKVGSVLKTGEDTF